MLPWVILIIIAIWYFSTRKKASSNANQKPSKYGIDEDYLEERQSNFEMDLDKEYLPDSLSYQEIYIYKNLMLPWFKELSAKYRYDEKMTQNIRSDWLTYMAELRSARSSIFLSFESDNEEYSKSEWEEAVKSGRKAMAIEDAFAASIGEEAKNELKKIRNLNQLKFGKNGKIAPEGYSYGLMHEELQRDDNE